MTTVVTGGGGFIGSMVCRRLVDRGRDVVVFDDFSNGRRELLEPLGVRIVKVDIRDAEALKAAFLEVKPTELCHLAAIHFIPYCNAHPQEAIATNVLGTLNVLEACRLAPPAMVVYASTAAVYPINDAPNREEDMPHPVDIYGVTKLCGEQLAELYVSQTEASCTSARIFNAVGPNETNPHVVPEIIEQLRGGATRVELGNLEPRRDYIDTRDLADGLISLLELRRPGHDTFNLGTGEEHSVRVLVQMCEEILGRTITIVERAERKRKVERMHLVASIEKATRTTGWRPRYNLRQSLEALLLA